MLRGSCWSHHISAGYCTGIVCVCGLRPSRSNGRLADRKSIGRTEEPTMGVMFLLPDGRLSRAQPGLPGGNRRSGPICLPVGPRQPRACRMKPSIRRLFSDYATYCPFANTHGKSFWKAASRRGLPTWVAACPCTPGSRQRLLPIHHTLRAAPRGLLWSKVSIFFTLLFASSGSTCWVDARPAQGRACFAAAVATLGLFRSPISCKDTSIYCLLTRWRRGSMWL